MTEMYRYICRVNTNLWKSESSFLYYVSTNSCFMYYSKFN